MAHYQPGIYDCIVEDQGFDKLNNEKQTPFFYLTVRPEKMDGAPVTSNDFTRDVKLWLTDKAIDRTIERLREMGWHGDDWTELENGSQSFKGASVSLICRNENGYDNFDFPPSGEQGSRESLSGAGKRLNALFGDKLKATSKRKPKDEKPAAVPAPDDDVPF